MLALVNNVCNKLLKYVMESGCKLSTTDVIDDVCTRPESLVPYNYNLSS